MVLDQDTMQRITTALKFCAEAFKICMGSFLVVFVPRQCGDHTCSIAENVELSSSSDLHAACLLSNATTCALFVALYAVELKRENFCIEFLDVDEKKSLENLDDEIEQYPEIKQKMFAFNSRYFLASAAVCVVVPINVALSLADLSAHWDGSPTLSPLISFLLLIGMKLYSSAHVSREAVLHEKAFSAYITQPLVYNTIDSDFSSSVAGRA